MTSTLVTGFTPFDGRNVNASWIAASSLAPRPGVTTREIPVIWGMPREVLGPLVAENSPHIIIGMGEGRAGWFDIETVARNTRKERPDNAEHLPDGEPVEPDGPDQRLASIDSVRLQEKIASEGYPIRVSSDAGAFLCEELLYTLEGLKTRHPSIRQVVFVHLPPFGSRFTLDGVEVVCDELRLERFATILLEAVWEMA